MMSCGIFESIQFSHPLLVFLSMLRSLGAELLITPTCSLTFSAGGSSMFHCTCVHLGTHLCPCYGLNVCVPPKFIKWIANLQCGGICRWDPGRSLGSHEILRVGHRAGVSGLTGRERESGVHCLSLSLGTGTEERPWGHTRRDGHLQARRKVFTRTWPWRHVDLGHPASRTVGK